MLSPSPVILSAAKDLALLRVNSAKHLLFMLQQKQILRCA